MSDPGRQRIARETLLALRLRRLVRVDEDRYADNGLITHAEYQLFLDDRCAQGEYHQPDHWPGYQFPPGQGRSPVVGVRPSDAVAFCEWLTARESGEWRYRPPKPGELDARDIDVPGGTGYWVVLGDRVEFVPLGIQNSHLMNEMIKKRLIIDRDLDFALAYEIDLAHAHTFARAHVRAYALVRDLNLALAHEFNLTLARAIALHRARSLILAFDLDLDQALALARNLDLTHNPARAVDLDLEHARVTAFVLASLLLRPLEVLPLHRYNTIKKSAGAIEHAANVCIDLYVALIILEERSKGNLPAFEGIRIVKERVK